MLKSDYTRVIVIKLDTIETLIIGCVLRRLFWLCSSNMSHKYDYKGFRVRNTKSYSSFSVYVLGALIETELLAFSGLI